MGGMEETNVNAKIMVTLIAALCCLTLSSCGNNAGPLSPESSDSSAHVHTFSDVWSANDVCHWHAATCEHTEKTKDLSAHTFNSWIIDEEATENAEGSRHHVCTVCDHRVDEIIPKTDHVHVWESPTYTWNLDNSTCTAQRRCSINRYHMEEEIASSTYSIITQPTAESPGVGRYVATFRNSAFKKQQKDVTIPKINVPVTAISLDKTALELSVGKSAILWETVYPSDATNKAVTWATTDDKVATVTSSGLVTGVGNGETVITVTTVEGGYTATCNVKVTHVPVTGISLLKTSLTLEEGETGDTIYATVSPSSASNTDVAWTIDDPSVAAISTTLMGGCKVTGVKAGTATVTATTVDGGFTATCVVRVLEQKNFSYLIGNPLVEIYEYSTSYSFDTRARVYVPVTNRGNVNIYIGTCSVDIEDANGNLKQSANYMSCHPDLIGPGETTYVYDDVSYTGDTTDNLVGVPHITIKDASAADGIRYDVSNVAFEEDSITGIKATGLVTNNHAEASGIAVVAVILFDKNGDYAATLYTYPSEKLEPGTSATFHATNLDMMYRKTIFTKDDIGSYQAYAYEKEYVL